MKFQENAVVCEIKSSGAFVELILESPKIVKEAKPGQFVNVRASQGLDPLLRRPISICDVKDGRLSLLINPVGKGTEFLCSRRTGETLDLIGPLGNAFPDADQPILQLAGGVGIAPFRFLSRGNSGSTLLFGARSENFFPDMSVFEELAEVRVATEDGSRGVKGNVLNLLDEIDLENRTVFACGPTPMFRALQEYFRQQPFDVDAWFSLETYMGCGFGACKGCTVEMTDGSYQLCCTDGPIFRWNSVKI